MKEDARSSLEKLQALEKDYGTFDQQLDALASVVGLDSRKRDTLNGSTAATHGAPQYPLGKASFALRWLLGKFQGDHVCRISPRAWQLLAQIIACLPPTTAAKFLKSSKFLRILESALEAAFPDRLEHTTEQASPKSNGDQNHSRVRSPVREKHTEEVTGLGKRKRKGTQDEEQGGKKAKRARATDSTSSGPSSITKTEITKPHGFSKHDDPAPLFLSMSFCLKKMVSPDSAQAAQQYLPALKSSPASICRIMGSWLRALRVLFSVQRSAPAEERKSALFNPALRLWHLNSHAVDTALFSSHVLLPAISLTALLAKPKPIHYKLDAEDVSVTTRDLERLIARHLLVPARRSFHDSRKSDPTTTDLDLTKLLEPISSQHRGSLGSVAKSETSQTSDSQPDLTPCLFSIALRSAPRSSVQKRLSEQPWLQGVFLALTQCLNLDSSHRSPSQSAQRLKELESMLKLAKKHDVTLTRPVLRDLTVDHGGLSTTSPEPQWSLLARVSIPSSTAERQITLYQGAVPWTDI